MNWWFCAFPPEIVWPICFPLTTALWTIADLWINILQYRATLILWVLLDCMFFSCQIISKLYTIWLYVEGLSNQPPAIHLECSLAPSNGQALRCYFSSFSTLHAVMRKLKQHLALSYVLSQHWFIPLKIRQTGFNLFPFHSSLWQEEAAAHTVCWEELKCH